MRMMKGSKAKLNEEWLRLLCLSSLEETEGEILLQLQLPHEGKKRGSYPAPHSADQ